LQSSKAWVELAGKPMQTKQRARRVRRISDLNG
jgi:hypothetical protein